MTIQGAVYELERMMLRDDIPDYIKPTIKKVIEVVVDEYNEILKAVPNEVLDKIKAEIDVARFIDKDTKLCKNANASGLEVAMQIIDKYRGEQCQP